MHYQPIVARLLTRREFYRIQRETHTNVVYLVEWCSEVLPKTPVLQTVSKVVQLVS
jgi:hypothetical protein